MESIDATQLEVILERLGTAADALAAANDEIGRCRESERTLLAVLDTVLTAVPTPVVVVDDRLRVRAASAAAESAGLGTAGADLAGGALASHVGTLRELVRTDAVDCDLGEGWRSQRVDDLDGENRYYVVWLDAAAQSST